MAISVRCPSCHCGYEVRESFAGRSVPCKSCGAVFAVPRSSKPAAAVEIVEFEDPADDYDDYDAHRPRRPATRPVQRARPATTAARPSAPRRRNPAPRRSAPPKGLAILMGVLAGISVLVASSLAIYKFGSRKSRGNDSADPLKDLPAEREARRQNDPPPAFPRPVRQPAAAPANLSVEFRVPRFSGAGDASAAARRALADIDWIDAGSIRYDAARRRIVARATKRSFNTSSALRSLRREGFTIGRVRISSRGL